MLLPPAPPIPLPLTPPAAGPFEGAPPAEGLPPSPSECSVTVPPHPAVSHASASADTTVVLNDIDSFLLLTRRLFYDERRKRPNDVQLAFAVARLSVSACFSGMNVMARSASAVIVSDGLTPGFTETAEPSIT